MKNQYQRRLADILQDIKKNDTNYDVRYNLIIKAMCLASKCEYKVGFRVDEENKWPIAVIHLPEGQLSWHMAPDDISYDGHTNDEKFTRIDQFSYNTTNILTDAIIADGEQQSAYWEAKQSN